MLYKKNGLTNESVLKAYEAYKRAEKKEVIGRHRSEFPWLAELSDDQIWEIHEAIIDHHLSGGDSASFIKKIREASNAPALEKLREASNAPALD